MTKILLPLLIALGLALGLYLLVRRRKIVIPENGSRLKVIVLLAAAALVGSLGTAGADKKSKVTCYKPVIPSEDDELVGPPYIDHINERIAVLDKLHAQGKLTDDVYYETLSSLRIEIEATEKKKKYKKALSKAEKRLVDLRRAMDKKLQKKLIKKTAWPILKKQTRQLHKVLAGKPNTFSQDRVDEALDELYADGLIENMTGHAVSVTISEVAYHYERANSGKTCYKPSMFGMGLRTWRSQLTVLLQDLKAKPPSKKEYAQDLGTLAVGVGCFTSMTEDSCDSSGTASMFERVSYVQALDLLIAMSK